jgi:phenylacetic acid degradation protein PaaD
MKDPFMAHLGLAVLHLAPGEAVVAGEVGEAHLNLHGTVHGGFLYALADSAFALASNSRGPAVALSCRMDYFRPLALGARVEARAKEVQTAEKQPTNPHTSSLGPPAPNEPLFRSRLIQEHKSSRRAAKEAKGGKMNPGMPKGAAPKLYLGVHARLVFLKEEDEQAVLDLMRRFSSATRFTYQRLLEGQDRKELKREDGPLCTLFGLNTRYADGAIEKAQATLDSARELGQDPRKVVFGGRKLFEQLTRGHLSGKALLALKRAWKERRQGLLYSRGDATKKGNANLRLEPQGDALWLRVNLGNSAYVHALVQTSHPQLKALLQRAYASLPYNVTIRLEDGKVYAHFTWSEGLPPPVHTKANGVLGIDANGDPYHLALAVVSPDGNLIRHLTLSLEEVDRAPNRGAKELLLWKVAHQVVAVAEEHGVAIATERLKYLRKSRRGDGSGRPFRRKQHRFAYRSLLEKIHSLARKRGVEVLEVGPQDTSTIGMLKYAPQLHLSKDVAAALVIGRRALGFEEKLPKGYEALLKDDAFLAHVQGFYGDRLQELQKLREAEKKPHLRRRLSRDMGKAKAALTLVSSLQGSPGSRKGVTEGRNPSGAHPWRVLRVGLFLPLLGLEVPRDLSPLKPILHLAPLTHGSWEGWKVGSGPHPGGGPECANVHFY